jgi:hypothetical protein
VALGKTHFSNLLKIVSGFDLWQTGFPTGSSANFGCMFSYLQFFFSEIIFPMLQMTDILPLSCSEVNINQRLGKSILIKLRMGEPAQ